MSLHFNQLFRKKLQKVPHFVKKHGKSSIWQTLATFRKKLPCFYVSMNFMAKSCKNYLTSWKSTKSHRVGQNYATFSNKLPCFGVSMNFSAKGCKKLLNSWKSGKNHRFGQNFATFRTNYHVFAFRSTFQEKVAKSASFREKPREIIDLAKTLQLFEQTTMSLHFHELFRKKLQKVPHFVKKHEKSSIWQKLCNVSNKLPCLCILMNFSEESCKKCLISLKNAKNHRFGQNLQLFRKKLQKVPHFVKKQEKKSILPKLCNFSNKLPCLCILMNFSERSCKKCLISWKSTSNHRFYQNLQLFEKTTMFLRFDELYGKKLQKLPHFVKKHEKS